MLKSEEILINQRENVHRNFGGQAQINDISPYILLVNSRREVENLIIKCESVKKIADHYEFTIYSGFFQGVYLTICSTGIGGTPISIAVEELCRLGASTFLQLGTVNSTKKEAQSNKFIIVKGVVRWDGASFDYVRPEFPALSNFEVMMAAAASAQSKKLSFDIDIVGDIPIFKKNEDIYYEHSNRRLINLKNKLNNIGITLGSGQSAILLIQSLLFGKRAGVILLNKIEMNSKKLKNLEDTLFILGLTTIQLISEWDKHKILNKQTYIFPSYPFDLFKK
jgi:uridine phosphorylase